MFLLAAGVAAAQGMDVEALGGGGLLTASGPSRAAGTIGISGCAFCAGHFGVFTEYVHWSTSEDAHGSNPSDAVKFANMGTVGLRIQTFSRARPFFDFGFAAGSDRHLDANTMRGLAGVVVGGGLRIPFKGAWYIRPQVRAYGLSPHTLEGVDAHWAVTGLIGIGYSWNSRRRRF